MYAGQQALGMLPQPMVSVHSLAALTEQMNGNNTRVLTKAAEEQAHDPASHRQDGQPGQPSAPDPPQATADSLALGSVKQEAEGSRLPTVSSAGYSGHSRASQGLRGAPHRLAAPRPTTDGALPNSASAADDAVARGSADSAGADAESSGQGSEQQLAGNNASARKPSRLGSLMSRFRRRKPSQAPTVSSSTAGGAAERADAEGHTAQQSSSAAPQLGLPSATPSYSDSAAPEQTPVTQLDDRPAAGAGASGQSSSAAAASGSEPPHEAGATHGAAAAQAPAQAAVRLDWDKMNESMMHSLHSVISNLTTVLIAQVSTQPCRVSSPAVTPSSMGGSSLQTCETALIVHVSAQLSACMSNRGARHRTQAKAGAAPA